MARGNARTILSLDRYARILGVNPAHFNQLGTGDDDVPMPFEARCKDVWFQHDWQNSDRVGRDDLARQIETAEEDIASSLGFWPGPVWIEKEVHPFPRHFYRDVYDSGLNVRWQRKSIQPRWSKLIEAGRRAVTFIANAEELGGELTYSDEDGDGYEETATITVPTTETQPCEIKAYWPDEDGDPEFEIRDPRSVSIVGGTATLVFFSWQLVPLDLWEAFPTVNNPLAPLKINDPANRLTEVDVYREFSDFSQPSSQFFWENRPRNIHPLFDAQCNNCNGNGCPACSLESLDGCLFVRDVDLGIAVPVPASFDEESQSWSEQNFVNCRAPDQTKIWYRAGELDEKFLSGRSCEPLKQKWAEAIAWLATARLYRPFCSCGTVEKFQSNMRRDLAKTEPDGTSYVTTEADLDNPFGTRKGEVMAWRRVNKLARIRPHVAVIA